MTSNQHGPYVRGYTRVTMGGHRGLLPGDGTPIPKPSLSTDWSLQPDSTKLDSLVIAHQPRRGEYVPGPWKVRLEHLLSGAVWRLCRFRFLRVEKIYML